MSKRQKRWWYQHGRGKVRYATRWRARRAVLSIWARELRLDSLQPYECRWTADWTAGRSGEPHWHIGHGRFTPGQRARRVIRHLVVYPYYRCRSRARRALGISRRS